MEFDKIIIGAGLYGLYAAMKSSEKGEKVLVLEKDPVPFGRATYINQARVHMGYHYPRSLTTAMKSAGYFRRFLEDYSFCIHKSFDQVYATSADFSWTNRRQFIEFCNSAGIFCKEVSPDTYFKSGMCDGAFLTEEYTYDAFVLRDYFLDYFSDNKNVTILTNTNVTEIVKDGSVFRVATEDSNGKNNEYSSAYVLNASYASVNQIIDKTKGIDKKDFNIKYELCEIILCKPSDMLKNVGITVMDGPFFSIMPFGLTGYHSLTAVTFTPHTSSFDKLPKFSCQQGTKCSPAQLANCNDCPNKPSTAWPYMSHLADKYLLDEYSYTYEKSLFSMKPILKSSEVDDSRPTAIRVLSDEPKFVSVLSGKINTVYDLDEYL